MNFINYLLQQMYTNSEAANRGRGKSFIPWVWYKFNKRIPFDWQQLEVNTSNK